MSDNPLLNPYGTPFDLPPFGRVRPEHFLPAFEEALAEHRAEIAAIGSDTRAPDFTNVVDALERAGERLSRVSAVFWNLSGAHTNPDIQTIEREISPRMAAHWAAIGTDQALFARVDALFARRADLELTPEQDRLLERTHTSFVRSGARLPQADRERLNAIVSGSRRSAPPSARTCSPTRRASSASSIRRRATSTDCPPSCIRRPPAPPRSAASPAATS